MKATDHGGNIFHLARMAHCQPHDIIDFSVNLRPEGPPPFLQSAMRKAMDSVNAYPSPHAEEACLAAAKRYALLAENFVFGNGSNELIHAVARFFAKQKKTHAYIVEPAFSEYALACQLAGLHIVPLWGGLHIQDQETFREKLLTLPRNSLLFMANPANPSGIFYHKKQMLSFIQARPDIIWVLDEAFVEYAGEEDDVSLVSLMPHLPDNVIILRSLTKFHAIAGVRLGFLVSNTDFCTRIKALLPAWSVNCFAIQAALAVLNDTSNFASQTRQENDHRRENLIQHLQSIDGIEIFPSVANFILFRHLKANQELAYTLLKEHGMAIRDCSNYTGLDDYTWYRVAVRFNHEHEKLCAALKNILL